MATTRKVWTPKSVARLFAISEKKVRDEIHAGRLPCLRVGRRFYLYRPHLEKYAGKEVVAHLLKNSDKSP